MKYSWRTVKRNRKKYKINKNKSNSNFNLPNLLYQITVLKKWRSYNSNQLSESKIMNYSVNFNQTKQMSLTQSLLQLIILPIRSQLWQHFKIHKFVNNQMNFNLLLPNPEQKRKGNNQKILNFKKKLPKSPSFKQYSRFNSQS
jgi:hypothetical protein